MSADDAKGHRYERNRAARRAAGEQRWTPATSKAPSPAQMKLLRSLAQETGQTFAMPRSSQQASARIKDLLALKRRKPKK